MKFSDYFTIIRNKEMMRSDDEMNNNLKITICIILSSLLGFWKFFSILVSYSFFLFQDTDLSQIVLRLFLQRICFRPMMHL